MNYISWQSNYLHKVIEIISKELRSIKTYYLGLSEMKRLVIAFYLKFVREHMQTMKNEETSLWKKGGSHFFIFSYTSSICSDHLPSSPNHLASASKHWRSFFIALKSITCTINYCWSIYIVFIIHVVINEQKYILNCVKHIK